MKVRIVLTSLAFLIAGTLPATEKSEESTAFRDMSVHYEAIRLALLSDSLTGVEDHAEAIRERADGLIDSFDAAEAGVDAEDSGACEALLPELSSAAAELAGAHSLEATRVAFFELSKPLGRYRKLAGIEGTVVAFCPMAKKAWIQPAGEIGNPYLGQEMPSCGEVIPD